ncbi:MAG: allantoin permease [Porticoccaceae bacterium]|jgi:purine-cytosine permease-like protein|nr:allantoin permease [Porticoccaceae bacterium]
MAEDLDYSTALVPSTARMPAGALSMAWWAVATAMFWLVVSASLAMSFGTLNALAGMSIAVVVYTITGGIISRYAIKTGLSVALFSRILFGYHGALLATLVFFTGAIYYSVFEASVIAVAIQDYFPSLSLSQAYLIVIAYSVPLVFGSVQHWLGKLNGILLPFYIIGLIAAVALSIYQYGYSNAWLELGPENALTGYGTWNCFTYFLGVCLTLMFAWDYARFGREEDSDFHTKFNFGSPFFLFAILVNGVAGIFLVATIPTEGELSEISVVLGLLKLMGFSGLIFIWVSQTRINTANFFMAIVNLESLFQRMPSIHVPKIVTATLVGITVYVVMLADVFSFLYQALSYLAIMVVAWVSIAITHILSPKYESLMGQELEIREGYVPALNLSGLLAWFLAAFVGLLFFNAGGLWVASSSPATAIVASVVYLLMLKRAKRSWYVIGKEANDQVT